MNISGDMDFETQCTRCQIIAEAMTNWSMGLLSDTFGVSLGPFAGFAERRSCKACQSVVQHFKADPSCHPFRPSCCLIFSRIVSNGRFWIQPAVLCGRDLNEEPICEEPHGYLELIPSAVLSQTMEHFVSVDPQWLDIPRACLWPKYCDENHHGLCHSLSEWATIEPAPSIILVDVDRYHLVRISQPKRYLALSYVWGRLPDILETTKNNFLQLQQIGALASKHWGSRLPSTVRDAIYFTKLMGERYLWVDRLCIIQDDYEHKEEQLGFMSSIYANSYFTIVAADGNDANFGLRGVCTSSSPRSYQPSILHFSPGCSMMQAPEFETQFNVKEWHKRGWTFQERTLSNRNLIFFQGKILWECRQAIWTEDVADVLDGLSPSRSTHKKSNRYSFEFLQWPDLHQFAKLMGLYNNRLLTYQSDALAAFSAIISVLSRSFQGGFFHGIPELYFDFGLLWRPNTPSERRPDFPSWSWVGWEGNIALSCLKKSHYLILDGEISSPSIEIHPMVIWHKTSKQAGEKSRIDNSYCSFQRMRKEAPLLLPGGWSRIKPSELSLNASNYPKDFSAFKHEGIPDVEFIHPIPVPLKPLVPKSATWNNHLTFKTARCFLFSSHILGTAHERAAWSNISNSMVPYCLSFLLIDGSGQWAGMIYSNFSDPNELVLGQRCEVIIISAGVAYVDRDQGLKIWLEELKFIDDIKGRGTYEFYNVLWIERKGEVAYRKALGRVWKEAWERQQVEEIDVILG